MKVSRKKPFLILIATLFLSFLISSKAFAAEIGENDPIYQKAIYHGVLTCFDTAGENGGLLGTITLGDFDGSANDFFEGYGNRNIVKTIGDSRYALISCKSLLTTKTAKTLETSSTPTVSVKEERLQGANYSRQSSVEAGGSDAKCYSYSYTKYTTRKSTGEFIKSNDYYTPSLCISKDSSGNFVTSSQDLPGQYDYNEAGLGQHQPIKFEKLGTNTLRLNINTDNTGFLGIYTYTYTDFTLSNYASEGELLAAVGNQIASVMGSTVSTSKVHNEDSVATGEACTGRCDYTPTETWRQTYYSTCQNFQYYTDNSGVKCTSNENLNGVFNNTSDSNITYKKLATRGQAQYNTVIGNFSNGLYNYNSIKLNEAEIYRLYQHYLTDIYEVTNLNCSDTALNGAGAYRARLWWSAENKYTQYCYFDVADSKKSISVNGVYSDGIFGNVVTLDELIERLNGLSLTEEPNSSIYVNDGQTDDGSGIIIDGTTGETVNQASCLNSGAAESLGWILCPIMKGLGDAAKNLYSDIVEPALQVNPRLFGAENPDSPTRQAWGTFQGIANMFFIVLLLVVIFSQLTGVGIDNYGIKRILPKLIVAAILVNFSYYICVILVDVSNIAGNGIQALFSGLSANLANVPAEMVMNDQTVSFGGTIGSTIITAVPIALGVWGAWTLLSQNPAILLSLAVSLLGIVISILFLFIILAAREAAIVVLTVISPLAFACYMLPNTKNLFDKWVKMGEGLLLVYPICGLLVGGGGYISKLLLSVSVEGTFTAFTALLISIVPIFFIPSVLRSSFAAMGNLGAKISGFGDRLRGGVDKRIRGTEAYKDAQKRGLERRINIKSGLDPKTGKPTKRGEKRIARSQSRLGRLLGADRRQSAYISAANKIRDEREGSDTQLTNVLARSGIANTEAPTDAEKAAGIPDKTVKYYDNLYKQAAEEGNLSRMNSILAAAKGHGVKDKEIAKMLRRNMSNINGQKIDAATRSAWASDIQQKYGNDFLATDFELNDWLRKGGVGTLGNYGDYAASGAMDITDVKPEDIGRLSGDSLAGLAQAGMINTSTARDALAKNPNLTAEKKIMLNAIAEGARVSNGTKFAQEAKDLATGKITDFGTLSQITNASQANIEKWMAATPQLVQNVERIQDTSVDLRPVSEGEFADIRRNGGAPLPQPGQQPPAQGSQNGNRGGQNGGGPTIIVP